MSKPILTCLVLAFALCTAAAAAGEAPLPAPAAAPAVATLLSAPAAGPSCVAAATPAVRDTTPEWLEKSCCIPRCRRDQDCTTFCGGPGQCVQVNSCCKECFCFQT
jgi:hypothetical protein